MISRAKQFILNHTKLIIICAAVLCVATATLIISNNKVCVCLDAGHGGSDFGAIGENERLEKDDNLALTLAVRDELEDMGIKVILTRKTDKFVSLEKRCKYANRRKAALFVSIHRNSTDSDSAAGFEAWIMSDAPQEDERLAQLILANVEKAGISKNRGLKQGSAGGSGNYFINSGTDMPSCLVEMGFVSSEVDNSLFDSGLELYAAAIAEGIAEYMTPQ